MTANLSSTIHSAWRSNRYEIAPFGRFFLRTGSLAAILICTGCNMFPERTYSGSPFPAPAYRPADPALLNAPRGPAAAASPPSAVQRPLTPEPADEPLREFGTPVPDPADPVNAVPVPQRATQRPATPAAEDPPLSGPQLGPPQTEREKPLQLFVSGPEKRPNGSGTEFRAVIRNRSSNPANEVSVEVDFDKALVFAGHEEHRVRQTLGRIGAGEEREVALTLISNEAGRHCARFAIYVEGSEVGWESVCVEFGP